METDAPVPPPPGVDPSNVACVYALKWKLYQLIVLGPEPNTPEAQQNELLQKYVRQLAHLYQLLSKALRGSITDAEVHIFPRTIRHEILTCALQLKGYNKGRTAPHAADIVPYQDFLKETLQMYPYVHRTIGGDAHLVESL